MVSHGRKPVVPGPSQTTEPRRGDVRDPMATPPQAATDGVDWRVSAADAHTRLNRLCPEIQC